MIQEQKYKTMIANYMNDIWFSSVFLPLAPVVIDMFGVIFDGTEDAAASTIGNIGTESPAWIRLGMGMAGGEEVNLTMVTI